MTVVQSHKPDLISTYSAKMSSIDFIVYILNTISFWLNVCSLLLILDATQLFQRPAQTRASNVVEL